MSHQDHLKPIAPNDLDVSHVADVLARLPAELRQQAIRAIVTLFDDGELTVDGCSLKPGLCWQGSRDGFYVRSTTWHNRCVIEEITLAAKDSTRR